MDKDFFSIVRKGKTYFRNIFGLVLLAALLGTSVFSYRVVIAAAGDVGYKDFSYSGASAPTGQKPQSKLWFNDGNWSGILYNNSAKKYQIYRFNWATQSWSTTGVAVDARSKSSADAMWDGSSLYIVSAVPPGASGDLNIYLYRFNYNSVSRTYALDAGFPVSLGSRAVETVVMDKDSTGKLWVTFTDVNSSGGRNVYVMHSLADDKTWSASYVIPVTGANNLKIDDISAIVRFNGKIGVMWSNQTDNTVYFAYHVDGDPDSAWILNPALQGRKYADDHINLKSLQSDASGQVFASVKTSLNDILPASSTEPLILLLTLDNHGGWSRRVVGRVTDNFTRPIVLIDNQNRQVYVFYTYQYGTQTSGGIYYKQASLDNSAVQFPDGIGTPFMSYSAYTHINNASSTKQALNSATDLLVIAGDDTGKYYFHNTIDLGAGMPTATFTPTAAVTATATAAATDTPIPLPTNTLTLTPQATSTSIATATATATAASTATVALSPTNTLTPQPTEPVIPTQTPALSNLFSDGFESGDFSAWSLMKTGGDGSATVQNQLVSSGVYAARLSESSLTGSYAYARKTLTAAQMELNASGDFQVITEGIAGGNVPLLRIYDGSGVRIVNVYRLNQNSSKIGIQYGGVYYTTSGVLPLNTWGSLRLHVIEAATGSGTVELYLNGSLIYQSTTANLGSAGMQTIQIGNDTTKQTFGVIADNILVTQ